MRHGNPSPSAPPIISPPRFVEPWRQTARQAAAALDHGAIVIGNNPSFFLYFGYAIASRHDHGLQPLDDFPYPGVYGPGEWMAAGRPVRSTVPPVKGVPVFGAGDPMVASEEWLDTHCRLESDARALHDSGYRLKKHFFPQLGELPWRVEVRRYACAAPQR